MTIKKPRLNQSHQTNDNKRKWRNEPIRAHSTNMQPVTGAKSGKTCNRCRARGKQATSAKRGKTCNRCQARETCNRCQARQNMQPVSSGCKLGETWFCSGLIEQGESLLTNSQEKGPYFTDFFHQLYDLSISLTHSKSTKRLLILHDNKPKRLSPPLHPPGS